LPAMAVYQPNRCRLTHRYRRQAGSYRDRINRTSLYEPCPRQIVIYSELARDYLKRHGEPHYEH